MNRWFFAVVVTTWAYQFSAIIFSPWRVFPFIRLKLSSCSLCIGLNSVYVLPLEATCSTPAVLVYLCFHLTHEEDSYQFAGVCGGICASANGRANNSTYKNGGSTPRAHSPVPAANESRPWSRVNHLKQKKRQESAKKRANEFEWYNAGHRKKSTRKIRNFSIFPSFCYTIIVTWNATWKNRPRSTV